VGWLPGDVLATVVASEDDDGTTNGSQLLKRWLNFSLERREEVVMRLFVHAAINSHDFQPSL
jgi:hypothetical protein